MPRSQRVMMLGLTALTALMGLVFSHFVAWVLLTSSTPNIPVAGMAELPLSLLLGSISALLVTVAIVKTPRTHLLAQEVSEELIRVSWPSREEITHATGVVIIAIVICATYLGLFDAMWLKVTDTFLGVAA